MTNKNTKALKPKKPKADKPVPQGRKQQTLPAPGMTAKRVLAVEEKANALRATRTERMDLQKLEATQEDELVAAMQEHGVKVYKFEGDEDELIVELKDKTKVQIRKAATARTEDE